MTPKVDQLLMFSALIIAVSICVILLLVPGPQDLASYTKTIASKMPSSQLSALDPYLESYRLRDEDHAFWEVSDGVKGLLQRMVNSFFFLLIVRAMHRKGLIKTRDLRYIVGRSILQAWYTLWAFPEALLCLIIEDRPHSDARLAVVYHGQVLFRASTLWSSAELQTTMFDLEKLL